MLVECSGLRCVVKAYLLTALSREDQYSVRRMIFIHSSISDDNIADFYAAWEDRDHIYVCMEYVGDRTLREFAASSGPLSEDTVRALLTAPMNTLARLHAAGVVHRDLTVDNFVLREDGRVKIVDLEHMVCIRWERPTRHVTTLAYTAPEVLKQPAEYAIESDVWSMALVCLECLTGAQPFLQVHGSRSADVRHGQGLRRILARCRTRGKTRGTPLRRRTPRRRPARPSVAAPSTSATSPRGPP